MRAEYITIMIYNFGIQRHPYPRNGKLRASVKSALNISLLSYGV